MIFQVQNQIRHRYFLLVTLLLFSGCNSQNIRDIADIARSGDPVDRAEKVLKQKGRAIVSNPENLPQELKALKAKLKKFKRIVDEIWGEDRDDDRHERKRNRDVSVTETDRRRHADDDRHRKRSRDDKTRYQDTHRYAARFKSIITYYTTTD